MLRMMLRRPVGDGGHASSPAGAEVSVVVARPTKQTWPSGEMGPEHLVKNLPDDAPERTDITVDDISDAAASQMLCKARASSYQHV